MRQTTIQRAAATAFGCLMLAGLAAAQPGSGGAGGSAGRAAGTSGPTAPPDGPILAGPVVPLPRMVRAIGEARALYAKGDLAGAEAACRGGIRSYYEAIEGANLPKGTIDYGPQEVFALLADILLDEGRSVEAAGLYARCVGLSSPGVRLGMAIALARAGEGAAALRALCNAVGSDDVQGVLGSDPDLPGTKSLAGIEATALMQRAVQVTPFDGDRAMHDLMGARRLAPRSAAVACRLGIVLSQLKKPGEAVVWFERAARGRGQWARRAREEAPFARAQAKKAADAARAAARSGVGR